jgi:PAS domain-containing protein
VAAHESLTRAFLTFTQAAGSLEKSYTQLQAEVARLHLELQRTNSELERTLEENARVRGYLARVVENLPCGVLVVSAKGALQIINPEARRLLEVPADWVPRTRNGLPPMFEPAIAGIPANSFLCEQETLVRGASGNRALGILRANISKASGRGCRHDLDCSGHHGTEAGGVRTGGRAEIAGAGRDCDRTGARDS